MQAKADKPATPAAYLAALPPDRREAIQAIRQTINKNLGTGFAEGMQYGMLAWFVPHAVYPPGYHCDPRQPLPFVSVASQKHHIGLYMFCVYADPAVQKRFVAAWKATGKKLDMGKGCIRVKDLDGVPLGVIGETIGHISAEEFIATYESVLPAKILEKHRARAGLGASGGVAAGPSREKAGARAGAGAGKKATKKVTKKAGAGATRKKAGKKATKKAASGTAKKTTKKVVRKAAK